jgi:DNA-directed RNA polymerase III subunit RPC5
LAIAADGKNPAKNPTNTTERPSFRSGRMDKQSYVSSKPIENVDRYCVGIMQDRELHLTPVKGIIQLRPSLYYFDKQDKRKKTEQKAEDDADNDEEEVKQVTVKFARTENEKVKKAREKSWQSLSSIAADEPWCETFWYAKESHRSELERQKMFAQQSIITGNALSLTSQEYLDQLMANQTEVIEKPVDTEEVTLPPTKVFSMCQLKTLPLLDQIKVILKNGRL